MKRLVVLTALILLVLSLLSACAPVVSPDTEEAFTVAKNIDPDDLKPVYFLLDDLGNKTYGVYEFQLNGKHCVVIADVYITPYADSNSAPSLSCD